MVTIWKQTNKTKMDYKAGVLLVLKKWEFNWETEHLLQKKHRITWQQNLALDKRELMIDACLYVKNSVFYFWEMILKGSFCVFVSQFCISCV